MNRGIDKLTLTFPKGAFHVADCRVEKGWGFKKFETEKYPVLPILFRDGRGSMIEATNVHRNTPQAQLDINKDGLRLILNPSKLITEHPFHLVGAEALPDVESLIDSTYLPLGVELNWPYAECTRLDQAHQAEMDEPLAAYGEILSCLKGKRLENIQYPNGSYFRNGQREVVFYGKAGNLKKYYKSEMGCPPRLFRGEVKFKNKEEVERRFGTLMWEGIKGKSNADLNEVYRAIMQKEIFMTSQGFQAYIPFQELRQRFEQHLTSKGKISSHTLNKYKAEHGIDALLARHGGVECYLEFLRAMGMSRQNIHNERKRIAQSRYVNMQDMERSNLNLLEELKLKFAA